MEKSHKYVYQFEEGSKDMKSILGGKGAGLCEMTNTGIPVPHGFIISTECCRDVIEQEKYPTGVREEILSHLKELERRTGQRLGEGNNPLLVSVRSGAAASMPGMMDTILNLGLNDQSVLGVGEVSKNMRFGWDSYRRFISMFGSIAKGIDEELFNNVLKEARAKKGVKEDYQLEEGDLKEVCEKYKAIYKEKVGSELPQNPEEQLFQAIDAVFNSWNTPRAIEFRKIHEISNLLGTAVCVVAMVFGNKGETSGTGVGFTRDPVSGEQKIMGEFLINAQGEDVVAGIRTPVSFENLKPIMPVVYEELLRLFGKLDAHYRDMIDVEFTIEQGKVWILQCRSGKRTCHAAIRIAIELLEEKLITEEEAVMRVEAKTLEHLLHPQFEAESQEAAKPIAKGLPASPGAAVGIAVFTSEKAVEMKESGAGKTILVKEETSPKDIGGMHASMGIITSRGGITSHAAVVARGMGKCCVVGCGDITFPEQGECRVGEEIVIKEGDLISLCGSSGNLYLGGIATAEPEVGGSYLGKLMDLCDKYKQMIVRANADSPAEAKRARAFGAEGIGLCRTEHMFFEEARILHMRMMIMSTTEEERRKHLAELLPYQLEDFRGIFQEMTGFPVVIRLLDPPLHEFLPKEEDEQEELAKAMGLELKEVKAHYLQMSESNPMLGFRGCRLGMKYPEINEMQVKAIFLAALEAKKGGFNPMPLIEVPLVGDVKEFLRGKEIVEKMAKETGVKGIIEYEIGTMIEVPRAAITADKLAQVCDFFSFGTNDLTQMTLGFSRDDVAKFIPIYIDQGVYDIDPFVGIDESGVGYLMKLTVFKSRGVKPDMPVGICKHPVIYIYIYIIYYIYYILYIYILYRWGAGRIPTFCGVLP